MYMNILWCKWVLPVFVLLACPYLHAQGAATAPSLMDQALNKISLPENDLLLAPQRWRGGGAHSLPYFDKTWDDWRLLDPVCQKTGRGLLLASGRFEPMLLSSIAALQGQEPASWTQERNPPTDIPSLHDAIIRLYNRMGWELTSEERQRLLVQSQVVPESCARTAAVLIAAIPDAMDARNKVLGHWVDPSESARTCKALNAWAVSYAYNPVIQGLIDDLDQNAPALQAQTPGTKNYVAFARGCLPLARAVDQARDILARLAVTEKFRFQWQTPIGLIDITGADNDTHNPAKSLLIVDAAGNDIYETTPDDAGKYLPVTLLVDAAGDDIYKAAPGTGIAYGVAGYSLLLDMAGNDVYQADSTSFGAAAGGVGMLVDLSGNDHYTVKIFGQGAATCGIGLLNDDQGNDQYDCYHLSQGLGKTLGFGALIDHDGDDRYAANDTDLAFRSVQTDQHNNSLSQGCSFGRRDHPGRGNSFAGGIGLLADGSGNDTYSAGLFAQGASYWFGLGLLYEGGGNDSYHGQWYVQGAAVHHGAAALVDVAGNDTYFAGIVQSIGHAKDFSAAVLHDMAGNDSYRAQGVSIGEALFNSVGVLWDDGGDDSITAIDGDVAGFATNGEEGPCLGMLIHGLGKWQIVGPQIKHVTGDYWNIRQPDGARRVGWQK